MTLGDQGGFLAVHTLTNADGLTVIDGLEHRRRVFCGHTGPFARADFKYVRD